MLRFPIDGIMRIFNVQWRLSIYCLKNTRNHKYKFEAIQRTIFVTIFDTYVKRFLPKS